MIKVRKVLNSLEFLADKMYDNSKKVSIYIKYMDVVALSTDDDLIKEERI